MRVENHSMQVSSIKKWTGAGILSLAALLAILPNARGGIVMTEDFGFWGDFSNDVQATSHYWTEEDPAHQFYANGNIAYSIDPDWTLDAPHFLSRDLRDSGELGVGESLSDPTITFDASMQWGDDTSSTLGSALKIVDPSNNGYMGEVRRNGDMYIYRVDAGATTQIAFLATGVAGKVRTISLSAIGGTLTLTGSDTGPLAIADTTYSDEFVTVGFGGRAVGENPYIDNVSVDATVIPEPATMALFGIVGIGCLFLRRLHM